jgi:hypothetical protein
MLSFWLSASASTWSMSEVAPNRNAGRVVGVNPSMASWLILLLESFWASFRRSSCSHSRCPEQELAHTSFYPSQVVVLHYRPLHDHVSLWVVLLQSPCIGLCGDIGAINKSRTEESSDTRVFDHKVRPSGWSSAYLVSLRSFTACWRALLTSWQPVFDFLACISCENKRFGSWRWIHDDAHHLDGANAIYPYWSPPTSPWQIIIPRHKAWSRSW